VKINLLLKCGLPNNHCGTLFIRFHLTVHTTPRQRSQTSITNIALLTW